MKLRDALDAYVPAWPELQGKTSLEFVVVAACACAQAENPRREIGDRLLAWAIERFGDPNPCAGALAAALRADWERMPQAFRDIVGDVRDGKRGILELIAWRGEGDDQPLVQSLKRNMLAIVGVGGAA